MLPKTADGGVITRKGGNIPLNHQRKVVDPRLARLAQQPDQPQNRLVVRVGGGERTVEQDVVAGLIVGEGAAVAVEDFPAGRLDDLRAAAALLLLGEVIGTVHNLNLHQPKGKNAKHCPEKGPQQDEPQAVAVNFHSEGSAPFL